MRLSQKDFGEISFEVMKLCFDIHNEIGRLFDEKIYKRILVTRMPSVTLEVDCERWNPGLPNAKRIQDYLIAFLNDVGSGLETLLYEEAIIHALDGHEKTDSEIQVSVAGRTVGQQNMRILSNGAGSKSYEPRPIPRRSRASHPKTTRAHQPPSHRVDQPHPKTNHIHHTHQIKYPHDFCASHSAKFIHCKKLVAER